MSNRDFEIRTEWEMHRIAHGYAVMEFEAPIEDMKRWIAESKGSIFARIINKLTEVLK